MENLTQESRAERIARYKAERRRELADRYANQEEERPSKWSRREKDGRGVRQSHFADGSISDAMNGGLGRNGTASEEEKPKISNGHSNSITDGGSVALTLDLAVQCGADGSRRRTRRYMPGDPAGSRKTSDRFRTQPVTAEEFQESVGIMEDENQDISQTDSKTDDRAKMSVAAKMSLFKELEKTAAPESSTFLKPRSSSSFHERRARRNDPRALTQPITFEETEMAVSPLSGDLSLQPCGEDERKLEDDAGIKLSMSEKLALFNKLSQPILGAAGDLVNDGGPLVACDRRRQKGARYRTQPITVDEVNLLQKGPVQLPHLHLSPHLSDRQQAQSINLKPSELRLSSSSSELTTPSLKPPAETHNAVRRDTEIKGILKKSTSEGVVWRSEARDEDELNGHDLKQNGGERRERQMKEERHMSVSPVDLSLAPLSNVPWRQRSRKDISKSSARPRRSALKPEESSTTPLDTQKKVSEHRSKSAIKGLSGDPRLTDFTGAETEADPTVPTEDCKNTGHQDETVSTNDSSAQTQCWEPVFSSVYSRPNSASQYVMCFNQRSLSYEAQEVSRLPQVHPQATEPRCEETVSSKSLTEVQMPSEVSESVKAKEVLTLEASSFSPCPTSGDAESNLSTLCQTDSPILSSAVAEHRRSVRPSRRTQGSRNPLRALAARDDVQQDFMQLEENTQQNPNRDIKNSNCSTEVTTSGKVSKPTVPYNKLMLIQVKGWRQVQVRLVEPMSRSLNSGDCFLLVSASHCFLWTGKFSNTIEREKASELALEIVTQRDLGCQAGSVIQLDEGVNTNGLEAAEFWKLLGGQMQYKDKAGDDDEQYERVISQSNCIYQLQGDRLSPHHLCWASLPHVSVLDSSQTLLFDFGSELYLWHGKDVVPSERKLALQLAQQVWDGAYDYSNCDINPLNPSGASSHILKQGIGRPDWALFGRVFDQNETVLFKEKFAKSSDQTRVEENHIDSSNQEEMPRPLVEPPAQPVTAEQWSCDVKALLSGVSILGVLRIVLDGVDVRRGRDLVTLNDGRQADLCTLAVKKWLIFEGEENEVASESLGQFHEDSTYAIRWTYSLKALGMDEERSALFIWKGRDSTISGRSLSHALTNQCSSPVHISEGEEPPCFLQLFEGGMVIHRQHNTGGWRLFCVRGDVSVEASLLEVKCCCSSLRSRGSLLLANSQQGAVYLWHGCKAHGRARQVAKQIVQCLKLTCPPELGLKTESFEKVREVEEGKESSDFWNAVGPKDRKSYDCMLQDPGKFNFTPRLFHLGVQSGMFKGVEFISPTNVSGVITAMPFIQERLFSTTQPALFLLDNYLEVYLWQSSEASSSECPDWDKKKKFAMETVLSYCKERNARRPPMAYLITEGAEPLTFTNIFPSWESKVPRVVQKKLTLVQDALATVNKAQFPLEDLLKRPLPDGVDPSHLENYLSQKDFKDTLGMTWNEYNCLSDLQKMDLKKSKGLF